MALKIIIAWYRFANRVWISLALGWGALLICLTPYLRPDRAGAFLVCSAIVAEVFHDKGYRKFIEQTLPGVSKAYTYSVVEAIHENRKDIEVEEHQMRRGNIRINAEPWTLFHLAKKNEFYLMAGKETWDINKTVNRVDRAVDVTIAITAIVGTVLWAYGHA